MAVQAVGSALPLSAQEVGNAFIQQYYHVLHHCPESVYKFYQDSSVLSRQDSNGVMTTVETMEKINEKILSMSDKDCIAEIKTVDAQRSHGDGVTVLVTGYLTGRDNVQKKFVQSFFLSPQVNGFFVLNDILKVVDGFNSTEATSNPVNGVSVNAQPVSTISEQHTHASDVQRAPPEPSAEEDVCNQEEVCDPSEHGDGSVTEEETIEVPEVPSHFNQREIVIETSASSGSQEDAPKISYASILKAKATPSPVPSKRPNVKVKPPIAHQEVTGSSKPVSVVEPPTSTSDSNPEKSNITEEESYSIYVRGLPQSATAEQLEEVFTKFGPIKQGGIQVRSNKQGFCFGFVEFESLSSLRSAIEASPVMIGNRKADVEEKRTSTRIPTGGSSNSGRGRYSASRGSFRGESFRGRGNFGGGRGYARNEFKGQGTRSSGGRGSEGFQRVDQNGTGGRQGGSK